MNTMTQGTQTCKKTLVKFGLVVVAVQVSCLLGSMFMGGLSSSLSLALSMMYYSWIGIMLTSTCIAYPLFVFYGTPKSWLCSIGVGFLAGFISGGLAYWLMGLISGYGNPEMDRVYFVYSMAGSVYGVFFMLFLHSVRKKYQHLFSFGSERK